MPTACSCRPVALWRSADTKITADIKVACVIEAYPETVGVFQAHGCPDMRKGFFHLMARIMSIKRAAGFHKIPLDELLQELNASIKS